MYRKNLLPVNRGCPVVVGLIRSSETYARTYEPVTCQPLVFRLSLVESNEVCELGSPGVSLVKH